MRPLSSLCKRTREILDVQHLLSPVRDQQQISTSRKGICALALLTSPSTPRLYRLRTCGKTDTFRSSPAHPKRNAREDDLLMLNITKQVVQMHSTATEVGTAVDWKSRLAKILIKGQFST